MLKIENKKNIKKFHNSLKIIKLLFNFKRRIVTTNIQIIKIKKYEKIKKAYLMLLYQKNKKKGKVNN